MLILLVSLLAESLASEVYCSVLHYRSKQNLEIERLCLKPKG